MSKTIIATTALVAAVILTSQTTEAKFTRHGLNPLLLEEDEEQWRFGKLPILKPILHEEEQRIRPKPKPHWRHTAELLEEDEEQKKRFVLPNPRYGVRPVELLEEDEEQWGFSGQVGSGGFGGSINHNGWNGSVTKPWGSGKPTYGVGYQGNVGGGQLNLGVNRGPGGTSGQVTWTKRFDEDEELEEQIYLPCRDKFDTQCYRCTGKICLMDEGEGEVPSTHRKRLSRTLEQLKRKVGRKD